MRTARGQLSLLDAKAPQQPAAFTDIPPPGTDLDVPGGERFSEAALEHAGTPPAPVPVSVPRPESLPAPQAERTPQSTPEHSSKEPTTAGGDTVAQHIAAFEIFLRIKRGKAERTVEGFTAEMRKFSNTEGFKGITIQELREHHILSYLNRCATKEENSPATIARRMAAIKSFCRWLLDRRLIPVDPAKTIRGPKREVVDYAILKAAEEDAFFSSSRESDLDHVLAHFLLGAGLKLGELVNLTLADVDLGKPSTDASGPPRRPSVTVRSPLAHKNRTLKLGFDFADSYVRYLEAEAIRRGEPLGVRTDQERVFLLPENTPNKLLKAIATRAGICRTVSSQVLRDTFAVHCLAAGDSMKTLFEKLGLKYDEKENEHIIEKYQTLLRTPR